MSRWLAFYCLLSSTAAFAAPDNPCMRELFHAEYGFKFLNPQWIKKFKLHEEQVLWKGKTLERFDRAKSHGVGISAALPTPGKPGAMQTDFVLYPMLEVSGAVLADDGSGIYVVSPEGAEFFSMSSIRFGTHYRLSLPGGKGDLRMRISAMGSDKRMHKIEASPCAAATNPKLDPDGRYPLEDIRVNFLLGRLRDVTSLIYSHMDFYRSLILNDELNWKNEVASAAARRGVRELPHEDVVAIWESTRTRNYWRARKAFSAHVAQIKGEIQRLMIPALRVCESDQSAQVRVAAHGAEQALTDLATNLTNIANE